MRTSIAIAIFFCLWFITLFGVLPFFAKTQDEAGDVVPGTPGSAPSGINIWKVFLVNTLVAIVAFAVVYAIIANFDAIAGLFGVFLRREPTT
jgi:predicted secreted protein